MICGVPVNRRILIILTLLLFYTSSSYALSVGPQTEPVNLSDYNRVRYVDADTGLDIPGNGSIALPWATIQYAMSQISDGAETNRYAVLVADGVYSGPVIISIWTDLFGGFESSTWSRDIFLHKTVIEDGEDKAVQMSNPHSRIDGFFITHTTLTVGGGITLAALDNNVTNNIIHHNNKSGGYFGNTVGGGIYSNNNNDILIRNNLVFSNTQGGIYMVKGVAEKNVIFRNTNMGGASVSGLSTFRKNIVLSNTPGYARHDLPGVAGLNISGPAQSIGNWILFNPANVAYGVGGIQTNGNALIGNNTIVGNSAFWLSGGDCPGGIYARNSGVIILNNILWNRAASPQDKEVVNWSNIALFQHCDVQGGAEESGFDEGIIDDYPVFRLNLSDISTEVSYSTSTLRTTINAPNETLEPAAWIGFPIKVGDQYSIVAANTANSIEVWDDVRSATPVSWEILDYRLDSSSPCIEAGTTVAAATSDIEGEFRPADTHNANGDWDPLTGGKWDIGADEWWDYEPPVFTGLQTAALGDGSVILAWNPALDSSDPCRYNIYMANASGGQNFSSPDYVTDATNFEVTGIITDRVYYFVVRAQDSFGNEETNTIEKSAKPRSVLFSLALEGSLESRHLTGLYGGGSDHARPALVDIDDDDDMDLFIGKGDGSISFWENAGSSLSGAWSAPAHSYGGINVGYYAAPAFGDVDGDGDLDLVIGSSDGTLSCFENVGTNRVPGWGLPQSDYADVDVASQSTPALGDLDADGDPDLVVGAADGTLTFVENLGGASWGPPLPNFGNVSVAAFASPALVDVDQDGDLDLIVGDITGHLTYMKNTGTASDAAWSGTPVSNWLGLSAGYNVAPAISDLRGDGQLDLFVGNRQGEVVNYVATETALGLGGSSFTMIDTGSSSAGTLGDLDGDGDLDLLIGSADGRLTFFRNIGSAVTALWASPEPYYGGIDVGSYSIPSLVDLNGDTLLDLCIGRQQGQVTYYQNTGSSATPSFSLTSSSLAGIDVGYYSAPTVYDVDNDGDEDLLIGAYDGTLTFCENVGSAVTPVWGTPISDYLSIDVGFFSIPVIEDLNGDTLPDLLLGNENGQLAAFYNDGALGVPLWTSEISPFAGVDVGEYSAPTLADIDGDGDQDLLVGEEDGGINFWRNMNEHLILTPNTVTVEQGMAVQFTVSGATGIVQWSLLRNQSGGSLTSGGLYTAGSVAGPSVFDVIEVEDSEDRFGRAHVNVVRPEDYLTSGKAIICAGRSGPTDAVWPSSDYLSQQAYRTCLLKGYSRDRIWFLSPEPNRDIDGDGNATNDIDSESTLANLEAVLTWASDAEELVLFCVDHGWEEGGAARFRINEGIDNVLTAAQLDGWLDGLQSSSDMKITAIIDSCKSGAFLPAMIPPAEKERITITSCAADELTYFLLDGAVSFSESFWNSIYSGSTVGQSYHLASAAMSRFQNSLIDDTGDGLYQPQIDGTLADVTEIGLQEISGADRPQIGQVLSNQTISGVTEVTLWASDVSATYPIEEVWAVVISPSFQVDPETSEPVLQVATQELIYADGSDRWEGNYPDLNESGTYKIIFYARDIYQSVSLPKQVYIHRTDFLEKAVLVVGAQDYGPGQPWSSSNYLGKYAYQTLLKRWFGKDDIYCFNTNPAQDWDNNGFNDDIDGRPSLSVLSNAITTQCAGADKLTVYLIGRGSPDSLVLSSTESLSASQLDTWLDTVQGIDGPEVYVVLDCQDSGSFADDLLPPAGRDRVVITSAAPGYQSYCEAGGIFSFSQFFLGRIYEGDNIRDAFNFGRPAIKYLSRGNQLPGMTDDGDGIMNEKADGVFARARYIGPGFMTGGDDLPTIGQIAEEIFLLSGETSATVWCSAVFDSDGIRSVTAEIVPPDWPVGEIVDLALTYDDASERYQADYSNFTTVGDYRVLYTAEDREGNVSAEKTGAVYQYSTADAFEIDDTTPEATLLVVNDALPQEHNFHDFADTDWVRFLAVDGEQYTLIVGAPGSLCDPVITIYSADDFSTPLFSPIDDAGYGEAESTIWDSTLTGSIYVQVQNYNPADTGDGTDYELQVLATYGISNGRVIDRGLDWLQLGWEPSADPNILFFEIYQSQLATSGYALVASLPASASRYTDVNLLSGTTYYYRIHEVDSAFNRHSLGSEFYGETEATNVTDWLRY